MKQARQTAIDFDVQNYFARARSDPSRRWPRPGSSVTSRAGSGPSVRSNVTCEEYVYPHWADRPFVEVRRVDVNQLLDRIEDEHGVRQADPSDHHPLAHGLAPEPRRRLHERRSSRA